MTLTTTSFPAVFVDAVAPTVAITSPSNGDYINIASNAANYAITGTCDDASATYDIQVNGASAPGQAGVSCDGASLSGTFNSTSYAEAAHSLTVVATDTSGNSATSAAVSVTKDTVAPTINSISVANNNYTVGADIDMTANFSETVNVSGTQLPFAMATSSENAAYTSGTGTSSILYRYTVTASDYDGNGIAINGPLQLGGGSIEDLADQPNQRLNFCAPADGRSQSK